MQVAEQLVKEIMPPDDFIEPGISPWRALFVMARKKDGSLRFCTDLIFVWMLLEISYQDP